MIGMLKGIVEEKIGHHILIDVSGVGYKVLATSEVLSKTKLGEKVKLYTYTYVREDTLELYGFSSLSDLRLFENLINVSGVGPKSAISIFSIGASEEILTAILKGDVNFFLSVPRLGRKNAQRIIIDLKTKLDKEGTLDLVDLSDSGNSEIETVLKGFGFSQKEIVTAIRGIGDEGETPEEKITLALKFLGK